MQKILVNGFIVGCFLLLTGCMNNTGSTNSGSLFSPYYPSNSGSNVAQSVQDALMRSDDPVIAQVRVSMNQNTVVLSGYVKKIRQSDTAEQIAREVQGVQAIQNNIIVRQ